MNRKKVGVCAWMDCERGLAQEILQEKISQQYSRHRSQESDTANFLQVKNLAKQRSSNNQYKQSKQKFSLKGFSKNGIASPSRFRSNQIQSFHENQSAASTIQKKEIQHRPISYATCGQQNLISQTFRKQTQISVTSAVPVQKTNNRITINYFSNEKQNKVTENNNHQILFQKNKCCIENINSRNEVFLNGRFDQRNNKKEELKQQSTLKKRDENIITEINFSDSNNEVKNEQQLNILLSTIITKHKQQKDFVRGGCRHHSQMISQNYQTQLSNHSIINKCQSNNYKSSDENTVNKFIQTSENFSQEEQKPSINTNLSQYDQFQIVQPLFSGGFRERKKTLGRELKIGIQQQRRMTCFQVPPNLFFEQLQTVQTIKSLDCHTERSYIDIKYMQNFNQIQDLNRLP